jgi:hypothetical protein
VINCLLGCFLGFEILVLRQWKQNIEAQEIMLSSKETKIIPIFVDLTIKLPQF